MINKKYFYSIGIDVVFIVILLLTLTAGRIILGGYLSQISQYDGLKQYQEVNEDNVEEVENALIEVEPIVKKALSSQYIINFILLIFYTLFIGTSWLIIGDKINKIRDILNYKKYYLFFGIINLIYFYIIYKLTFFIVDTLNILDYLMPTDFGYGQIIMVVLSLILIVILTFIYFLLSCRFDVKLNLIFKNLKFKKVLLFILMFAVMFLFWTNFFNLFINHLAGYLVLFEWYNYVFLILLFILSEYLRIKFLRI